jgi:hypothetical protein
VDRRLWLRSRERSLRVDEHVGTVKFGAQEGSLKEKLHICLRICNFGFWHWGQNANYISASGYANMDFGTGGKTQKYISASGYAISVFCTRARTQNYISANGYAISVFFIGAKTQNYISASGYVNVVPNKWQIRDPSGPQIRLL